MACPLVGTMVSTTELLISDEFVIKLPPLVQ